MSVHNGYKNIHYCRDCTIWHVIYEHLGRQSVIINQFDLDVGL